MINLADMVLSDRTDEFFQIAESYASLTNASGFAGGASGLGRGGEPPHPIQGVFNTTAAAIGKALNATSVQLEELGKAVKQRGIFNDKTPLIQQLTFDIQRRITDLKTQIEALDQKVKEASAVNPHYHAHHTNMVETLKTRLLDVTKEFQDVLTTRTEMMKKQDSRRNMYSFSSGMASKLPTSASHAADVDIESGVQEMQFAEQGSAYLQSRAEAVESVQRAIAELAQIFQKVATMVTHQEEMVQRIDQETDRTAANISMGQSELLRYYNSISSNRMLILKVFGVVLFFILFFIVFLA
eukprot:Selendium_serpulae@DN2309_c0_g1_i1.p1